MDWLPAGEGIVISVLEPDEVLSDAPEVELSVLARIIGDAADTYGQPIALGEWWDRRRCRSTSCSTPAPARATPYDADGKPPAAWSPSSVNSELRPPLTRAAATMAV